MSADYDFGRWLSSPPPGDEVVITGISGRFPESNNVYELQKNLFDQLNLTTEDNRRWDVNLPGVPKRFGKIKDIEKFDGGFFGVHHGQAEAMSPMIRKSLELAVEAILDAGVNPSELRGSKTGVFAATAPVFSDVFVLRDTKRRKFRITACSTADISHRISYFLKMRGPSCGIEMDCSGSFIGLDMANTSLRLGKCDNAIVVACNLLQHPEVSRELAEIGILSPEGISRVFDQDANGYVRSEAVACIFLQRAKSARRIYAKVAHIKVGCDGYKLEGITVPSPQMQTRLMQNTLSESGIDPSAISYLEAHGTGTKIGDPHESDSIDTAIAQKRQTPLLVGAVKNNIGHSEASSGLCSLIKVIIAMETGLIPPTINVKQLKKGIQGFEQNRMRVVTKVEILPEDAYVGINCFGWGGGITHLIVQRFGNKKIDDALARTDFPRLVLVSGRSREAVLDLLDDVAKQPDENYISLLQQIFKDNVNGHVFRGFAVLEKDGVKEISVKFDNQRRRDLFVFFGPFENGFKVLGRHLLKVPLFKSTTERIFKGFLEQRPNFDKALVNLKKDTTLTAFAVQLGVVEVLKLLEIELTPLSDDPLYHLITLYHDTKIDLEETITRAYQILTTDQTHPKYFDEVPVPKQATVLNISDEPLRSTTFDINISSNFLQILGRLHQRGHNPQIHKLYPNVKFPVPRNTPMISHLVQWNHNKNWYTYKFADSNSLQRLYEISYENYEYLTGYQIDGVGTVPASQVLHLVWQTFKPWLNSAVVFENCHFLEPLIMPKNDKVKLKVFVSILLGSGNFEVCKDNTVVACGRIFVPEDVKMYQIDIPSCSCGDEDPTEILTEDDIYKELNLKNYNYGGLFKGVKKCNVDVSTGLLRWENNWTTFLDSLLQVAVLQDDTNCHCIPVGIRRLTIDAPNHVTAKKTCPFFAYKNCKIIKSGGVEVYGVATKRTKIQSHQTPVLTKHVFIPDVVALTLENSLRVNTQIIVEKSGQDNINAVEIFDDNNKVEPSLPTVHQILNEMPLVTSDFTVSTKTDLEKYPKNVPLTRSQNLLLVVATKVLEKPSILNQILTSLGDRGFILAREDRHFDCKKIDNLEVLTEHFTKDEKLILLEKSKLTSIVQNGLKHEPCIRVNGTRDNNNNKKGTYRYLPLHEGPRTSNGTRFCCHKDKSYVIVESLDGFGLELANWLVANDATKIVLVAKSRFQTGYQARKIRLWKSRGATVVLSTRDATTKGGCYQLVQEASNLGPVDGIFNLEPSKLRSRIASCLDEITRENCQNLRYFVTFSTVCQNNSGMANFIVERICEKRRNDGLPGLVIQWGPLEDLGVSSKPDKVPFQGLVPQKLSSCFDVLNEVLNQPNPVVSSTVIAEKNVDHAEQKGILERVAHVLGIKDVRNVNMTSTLAQVGIDSIGGAQIVQILELDFGISLSLKDIRNLTVARLIEMVEQVTENGT